MAYSLVWDLWFRWSCIKHDMLYDYSCFLFFFFETSTPARQRRIECACETRQDKTTNMKRQSFHALQEYTYCNYAGTIKPIESPMRINCRSFDILFQSNSLWKLSHASTQVRVHPKFKGCSSVDRMSICMDPKIGESIDWRLADVNDCSGANFFKRKIEFSVSYRISYARFGHHATQIWKNHDFIHKSRIFYFARDDPTSRSERERWEKKAEINNLLIKYLAQLSLRLILRQIRYDLNRL